MKRGITLLETLFAIGVLLVGLIGVFSLLPVAQRYMSDAASIDRSEAIGRSALADIEVRGLSNTNRWAVPQGSGAFSRVLANDGTFAIDSATGNQLLPPFVIDPYSIVRNLGSQPMAFPQTALAGGPLLRRLTVTTKATGAPVPMAAAMVDRIFVSGDDLQFDVPDDPTKRPTVNRGNKGDFSYFITVDNQYVAKPDGTLRPSGLWSVSVACVRKRDVALPTAGMVPPERQVLIDLPAFSSGDAILRHAKAEWLAVRSNQWLLVLLPMNDSTLPSGVRLRAVWQRVSAAGEVETDPAVANSFQRRITLAGADLPIIDASGNPLWNDADSSTVFPTSWAVLVDGVTGVFETTIEQGK